MLGTARSALPERQLLMAAIDRTPSGRWQATYKAHGREFAKTFDRKVDAVAWARSAEQDIQRGVWMDPRRSRILVNNWIDIWLPTRRSDLRATSYERLVSICDRHIRPHWGIRRLDHVTNADVRRWAADLQGTLASRTARKVLLAFRQLLAAAVDDRRLAINPAAQVPMPADHGTERAWMSLDEAIALRDAIDPRYRAVILLGYWCGLRIGELTALRRYDIDVDRSRIHVRRTAQQTAGKITFGPPKSAAGRRTVPVPRTVMQELSVYMNSYTDAPTDALVITTAAGTPLNRQNFLRRVWRPALASARLPAELTPHSMRHGYASLLIAGGFSVKEVSQWCGHSSSTITLGVYAHVASHQEDDAPERLDTFLSSFDDG